MSASIHMDIAGIHFAIHCEGLPVIPDPWPSYASFLTPPSVGKSDVRIDLRVAVGGGPELKTLSKLFDGESWSLFRHGDGYCLALNPSVSGVPPAWVACVDRDFTEGTVFCDEMLVRDNDGVRGIVNPILHRLDQLLTMYILARRRGILVHAAGAGVHGRGYIFAGRSGAGKSTIARRFAEDATTRGGITLFSDDRMVIREFSDGVRAFGTPWAGDAGIALNDSVPLTAIFFLCQAATNRIEPLDAKSALERILPLVSVPWYDREMIVRITGFCDDLTRRVPAYDLHFLPTSEVVGLIRQFAVERGT